MADIPDPQSNDETNVTDIELMPDGRIFVFGTSREVLDVLNELQAPGGEVASRLATCVRSSQPQSPNSDSTP